MRIEKKSGSPSLFFCYLSVSGWPSHWILSLLLSRQFITHSSWILLLLFQRSRSSSLYFILYFFARVARRQSRPIFNNHTQGATGLFLICAKDQRPKTKTHKSFFLLKMKVSLNFCLPIRNYIGRSRASGFELTASWINSRASPRPKENQHPWALAPLSSYSMQ